MPESVNPILPHLPAFVLVLMRMTGLFVFAPLFGSNLVPARVKVMLALTLSVCVYPLLPPQVPVTAAPMSLAFAGAGELLIGMAIGYGAALPLIAMQMAGRLMGQQLGLGFSELIDPTADEQDEPLSRLLYLVALALFLLMDGHHAVLAVLIGSYQNVPLGGYTMEGKLLHAMVGLLGSMLELAVRIAAPLLTLVFLETVTMGFLARTVPQLNILSVGFPLRIVLGLALLAVTLAAMAAAFAGSMRETMAIMQGIFN